jgi:hypothetical protein
LTDEDNERLDRAVSQNEKYARADPSGIVRVAKNSERLYRIWARIRSKCSNPRDDKFPHYGALDIRVSETWNKHYERFKEWALENGYSDDKFLLREFADGDFSPSNCFWGDKEEIPGRGKSR